MEVKERRRRQKLLCQKLRDSRGIICIVSCRNKRHYCFAWRYTVYFDMIAFDIAENSPTKPNDDCQLPDYCRVPMDASHGSSCHTR